MFSKFKTNAGAGAWRLLFVPAEMPELPSVSIVIRSKNDAALIGATLEAVHTQTFAGRIETIHIDSGSTDATVETIRLADAYALDPRNADVRSFQAQILERIGKILLARVEYIAAQQADPANLLLRDQLAEFYRRCGSIDDALAVWTGDAAKPVYDYMWVKTWF